MVFSCLSHHRRVMWSARVAVGLALACVWTTAAQAQSAAVSGQVSNEHGAAIANAEVTLRSLLPPGAPAARPMPGMPMPANERMTRTSPDGTFAFEQIAAGEYVVQVDAPGLERFSRPVTVSTQPQKLAVVLNVLEIPGAEAPRPAMPETGSGTEALLHRIAMLEQQNAALNQRITDLEGLAVLSEPETFVKRVEVWVDENGVEYDQPGPGRRRAETYRREAVYRRQNIGERIEEALADAENRSVRVGVDATTTTQLAGRTRGEAATPDKSAYALASADLFFTAGLAQYTLFFADVVGLSGSPPDNQIPGLTLLNGYGARLVRQNELNLREAWLRTELFRQRLGLIAGRLDLTNYFDNNVAANDETRQFLGDALVNNPALGLSSNGTGFAAIYDPKIGVNFKFGMQQSNADALNLSDSIFSLAEVGVVATPFGLLEGNYRVWGRMDNSIRQRRTAFGASLDQKITPVTTLFARYGNGDIPVVTGPTAFSLGQEFYSAGVQFRNGLVFNRWDVWGIGYAQTRLAPGDDEKLVEGYYNLALTERLHLSFHLQHVLRPGEASSRVGYLLPGVRLQAAF